MLLRDFDSSEVWATWVKYYPMMQNCQSEEIKDYKIKIDDIVITFKTYLFRFCDKSHGCQIIDTVLIKKYDAFVFVGTTKNSWYTSLLTKDYGFLGGLIITDAYAKSTTVYEISSH